MLKYVVPTLISVATSLAVCVAVYVLLFEFGDADTHDDIEKMLQITAIVVVISSIALMVSEITDNRSEIVGLVSAGCHVFLHGLMALPLLAAYLGSLMEAAPDSPVYLVFPACWIAMIILPVVARQATPRRWILN